MLRYSSLGEPVSKARSNPLGGARGVFITMENGEGDDETDDLPDDITVLPKIDKDILVHHLKERFRQGVIFTAIGDILLMVNPCRPTKLYGKKYHRRYKSRKRCDIPHTYWITTNAYRNQLHTFNNQCVLVNGDSGSGKTEVASHVVSHMIYLSERKRRQHGGTWDVKDDTAFYDELEACDYVLEFLGNSRTEHNTDSSMIGRLWELFFTQEGYICGANIGVALFGESVLLPRDSTDGVFHGLYNILAGFPQKQKDSYFIREPEEYSFWMNYREDSSDRRSSYTDSHEERFERFIESLEVVGFREQEISRILLVLSATVNILDIIHKENGILDQNDERTIQEVCDLLSVDSRFFINHVTQTVNLHSESVAYLTTAGLGAFVKVLYMCLLDAIVQRTNDSLCPNLSTRSKTFSTFAVLDMPGFRNQSINSLEELCVNAADERLHRVFLDAVFLAELRDVLNKDDVKCFPDTSTVVDVLYQIPQGVFHLVSMETDRHSSDDGTLWHALRTQLPKTPTVRMGDESGCSFFIRHYTGMVKYDCSGMLESNGDRLGSKLFEYVRQSCSDRVLVELLTGGCSLNSLDRRPAWASSEDSRTFKDSDTQNCSILENRRGRFYSQYITKSLEDIIQRISNSNKWFIKCIRPNRDLEAGVFNEELVMEQIECTKLADVAEAEKNGYTVRLHPDEFLHRYRDISFLYGDVIQPTTDNCEQVLKDAGLEDYLVNENKIYLKIWQEPYLQELVTAILIENEEQSRAPSLPSMSSVKSGYTSSRNNATSAVDSGLLMSSGYSNHTGSKSERAISFDRTASHTNEKRSPSKTGSNRTEHKASFVSDWMKNQNASPSGTMTPRIEFKKKGEMEEHVKALTQKKVLDPRWWDRFQMMPREHVSSSATFRTMFKFFKVICYLLLFCIVLGSAVVNKLCVLLMTSSITNDPLPESQWPAKTMLIVSLCFPYSLWFLTYSAKTMFGSNNWPPFSLVSITLFYEFLHTLGLCLLVFRVLPMLDMFKGFIVLGSIYVVPALLKTVFEGREPSYGVVRKCIMFFLNVAALMIQMGSIVACALFSITMTAEDKSNLREQVLIGGEDIVVELDSSTAVTNPSVMWELPISLLLISTTYWECFVDGDLSVCGYRLHFKKWKRHLHHARSRLYLFASIWKALWVVVIAVLLQPGFGFNMMFTAEEPELAINTTMSTADMSTTLRMRREVEGTTIGLDTSNATTEAAAAVTGFALHPDVLKHFELYGILYIQLLSNVILTYFAGAACKMCMQIVGFSLPLMLTTPISVAIVVLQCKFKFLSTGNLVWIGVKSDPDMWIVYLSWLGILWITELYVNAHIWFPSNGRMEKIDRLFVTPLRCGILTDQSLMLRRRRHDQELHLMLDDESSCITPDPEVHKADDEVPQIYACATMWHETRAEMTNLLKSIFRMDIDHSGRYLAQKFYQIRDPDYYEFEAHIFFDDAMEISDDDRLVPNMFVTDLMDCIDDSLSSVHERQMSLGPPTRTPTPYGGRLTWKLPGGSKMIVHLKDKHKIRHKKRWSQVMYMYYLLGYRILAQPENLLKKNMMDKSNPTEEFQRVKLTEAQLRRRRKAAHFTRSVIFNYVTDEVHTQAENTYILTLDGDVDFHPDAVRLLLDRMKTNKKVGAACGRIHPVGSGPLLWYQQFEYAIGHWLQKATEHVFGCVMCAPGCFSLFRGSALMDDNVARTYATRATEATHYVQYDQGEDRWLSTLLLQQGYRIDYCAAADALTHAPETFSEFFNQRRRWGPSTLANIVELLGSWKGTIKINDNISTFYILYLFCMVVSTVLGPATVLLMMAGAFTVVFKTGVMGSYALALVPAICFILICVFGKPSTQMMVATIMSAAYAIVMTIVLVATVGQAIEGGFTSPNVVFLIMLIVIFLVSASLHPAEFFCIIPGALYFICLPTGYLLLPIYFLSNMNTVSWGTREVPKRKTKEELIEEKMLEEEKRKRKDEKKKGIFAWIGLSSVLKEMMESLRQLRSDNSQNKSKTDALLEDLIVELRSNKTPAPVTRPRSTSSGTMTDEPAKELKKAIKDAETETEMKNFKNKMLDISRDWVIREDPKWPAWLQSRICGEGPIKELPDRETIFWNQIISKYLHPISEDRSHQQKVTDDLKNLRNNVVFGFFMTSALWVALAVQLQVLQEELKDIMFFKIPRIGNTDKLAFEPLGLFFLAFFAGILCIQFIGMFAHRWGTVLHMLSITEVSCGKTFTEKDKVRDIIMKAMELQKLCNIENEPEPDYDEPMPDYEFSDDDGFDTNSMATADSIPISQISFNPPSYHSMMPVAPPRRRRRGKEIFNTRGFSTGAALRRAFEKRFRNENLGQGAYDMDEADGVQPTVAEYDQDQHSLVSHI